MTVAATIRKAGPYTCNGVQVAFPFSFKVFQASDVVVTQTDLSAAETTLTLTSQYTITLNANQDSTPGGTVTLLAAPANLFLITLSSGVALSQSTVLTNNGGFFPATVNDMADRATIQIQQLQEQVNRSVKVPISSSASPDALVASVNAAASAAAGSAAAAAGSVVSAAAQVALAQAAVASAYVGIPTWAVGVSYTHPSVTIRSGLTYITVQANAGNDPATDSTNTYWRRWAFTDAQLALATTGRLIDVQIFSTVGTFTYTRPAGMSSAGFAIVKGIGGGGSGAGCPNSTASNCNIGGGGAAGSYAEVMFTYTQLGATAAVVIPGTAAGVSAGGTNGGDTTFTCAATGVATFYGGGQGSTTGNGSAIGSFSGGAGPSFPLVVNGTVLLSVRGASSELCHRMTATSGFAPGGGRSYLGSYGSSPQFFSSVSFNGGSQSGPGGGGNGSVSANAAGASAGGTGQIGWLAVYSYA
ncbi:MAG: hypothetical protein PSX71_08590 [bacterium]|nr:hypothetical protein [bacterium]